ncbi:MAG: hypothetical protein U0105_23470 [Candidatus Obscuribacterales bacterium]
MTFPGETTEPSPKEDVLSAFQNRRGDETRDILSQHAMGLAKQTSGGSALGLDTAVVAGTGFVAGSAATALGEYALGRAVEPLSKVGGAIAFGLLGRGDVAASILYAPRLPWYSLLTPKPIVIGGLAVAAIAGISYEALKK